MMTPEMMEEVKEAQAEIEREFAVLKEMVAVLATADASEEE